VGSKYKARLERHIPIHHHDAAVEGMYALLYVQVIRYNACGVDLDMFVCDDFRRISKIVLMA